MSPGLYASLYACMYACMHACMYVYVHVCIHACIHTYINTYINAYIHICLLISQVSIYLSVYLFEQGQKKGHAPAKLSGAKGLAHQNLWAIRTLNGTVGAYALFPKLWPTILNVATVLDTSNALQHDIDCYLGLCVRHGASEVAQPLCLLSWA